MSYFGLVIFQKLDIQKRQDKQIIFLIIETKLKCNWFINSPVTPVYFSINVTKQKKVWYIVWPKKQTLFQTGVVEPELGIAYSIYIFTVVPIIWCFKLFTMI